MIERYAKQLIVVRNDLRSKLRHGKLAAQVAHASMGAALSGRMIEGEQLVLDLSPAQAAWFSGAFTKVVLKVDDEDHLLELTELCKVNRLRHCLILDAGRTVFNEPTHTCLGIGPEWSNELDALFTHLSLY